MPWDDEEDAQTSNTILQTVYVTQCNVTEKYKVTCLGRKCCVNEATLVSHPVK